MLRQRHEHEKGWVICALALIVPLLLASCYREHRQDSAHSPEAHGRLEVAEHTHPHEAEADVGHTHAPVAQEAQLRKPPKQILRNLSVISAYTFDPTKGEKGRISYELLEPARIRIVISEKDDPDQLYRILFWDWQEAGPQTVEW
ncbi:MAG: hypothetical protein JSW27_04830, partial [Phycisphaerales bacterium]